MTDAELAHQIKSSADYIREKKALHEEQELRELDEGEALTLREELKAKIEAAHEKTRALQQILLPLTVKSRHFPSIEIEDLINRAWEGVQETELACSLLLHDKLRPATRAKPFHQLAALNAIYLNSGPEAREIARSIITQAGLTEEYSDSSLTSWLKEARDNPEQMQKEIRWKLGQFYADD